MNTDSKLWKLRKWSKEWAERPLNRNEVSQILKKQHCIYFWHNEVLIRRCYYERYEHRDMHHGDVRAMVKYADDSAILGESFGATDNPLNIIYECSYCVDLGNRSDLEIICRKKLKRGEIRAINEYAERMGLKLCEMYALLFPPVRLLSTVNRDFLRIGLQKILYPVFPFKPDDGFRDPAFQRLWHRNVTIIGDGKKYIDRLYRLSE